MKQKLSPRRRALSLLLALSLIFGLLPGSVFAAEAAEPEAVSNGHWASSYLNQLVEWGFIRADQAQDPDRLLTRADFMSIVNRAYGYHEPGATPFEDVTEYDWFYDDVNIAYNAGYIKGVSDTEAGPNMTLDRQTATTILARNMMLQESPGEMTEFSDVREIDNWARGVIKSSMEHYLVTGYDDGTFRPKKAMTWGEIAALVSRTIGTPLQDAGDYSLGGVFGNVTITSPGVTLRDTVVSGDLYITGGVGLGGVKLENVTVLGRIIASGTGSSEGGASILLRNVMADELLIDNLRDNEVSVQADGITEIGKTTVRTSAYIQDNTPEGMGLHLISLEGDYYGEDEEPPEGWEPAKLTLAGRIEEVINRTPDTTVHVAKGTVAKLTVDETAQGSHVIIDRGAVVKNLILDAGIDVTGDGDITHLEVNAEGATVEMLPDEIVIRPGITAVIAGHEMDSASAEEFLLDPMILAGYPRAQDIAPTSLEAVFAGNKQGRIYWAVSAVTDGSIGAEDLLKPPSYGNKAVRWGTADLPRGNEEVISKITGLTSNGEYYLSAVLEDAKGQLSPVKVISFTTPDNTIPAFNKGYPYMSKKSALDSIVVASVTKDCKLYYALLPENATAPTEADFRANAVAGALGFGIVDMQKNIEAAFRVNDQVLQEKTKYILYLWLVDADGVNKSAVVSLPFTTDDETPPEFVMGPEVNSVQATSVGLRFRLNEDGTVYWVAVPAGTVYPKPEPGTEYDRAPLTSDYAKLQVASGMNLGTDGKSGRVTAKEMVDGTINVTGLKPETAYDFYYVAKDNAGPDRNYSYTVGKMTINTLDTSGPKFVQSFSKPSRQGSNTEARANTDIWIDVSENVRYAGDGGGRGFLELYNDIASGGTVAVDKLAHNLANSIWLCKSGASNSDAESDRVRYIYRTADKNLFTAEGSEYVIDYTQAKVESRTGGAIRITFPASALRLENGAEYYFVVRDVTDTSNNYNPLENPAVVDFKHDRALSAAAGHDLPPFTIDPATLLLSEPDAGMLGSAAKDGAQPGRPLAIDADDEGRMLFFRMEPDSTETTVDSLCYDLLFWSNKGVDFDLYYRIVNKSGSPTDASGKTYSSTTPAENMLPYKGGKEDITARVPDANGWIKLISDWHLSPNTKAKSPNDRAGVSINKYFNGCNSSTFPKLNSLRSDLGYEFVIVIQRLNNISEYKSWSEDINFYVNAVSGGSSRLDYLATQMYNLPASSYQLWDDFTKNTGSMEGRGGKSISRTNLASSPEILPLLWSKNPRLPKLDGYPTFTPKATSSSMTIKLDVKGTVTYVVAKAKSQYNNGDPAVPITRLLLANDTEKGDGTKTTNVTMKVDESLQPPKSGEGLPVWMRGTDDPVNATEETVDVPQKKNTITNPTNYQVRDLTVSTAGLNEGFNSGTIPCDGVRPSTEPIGSTNKEHEPLEPDTDYFVYFVIESDAGGDPSHVYVYQFRTQPDMKPWISLSWSGSEMSREIDSDGDPTYGYFRVFTSYDATSDNITILTKPFIEWIEEGITIPKDYRDYTVLQALEETYDYYTVRGETGIYYPYVIDDYGEPNYTKYNDYSVFDIYASEQARRQIYHLVEDGALYWPEEAKISVRGPEGAVYTNPNTGYTTYPTVKLGDIDSSRYVFITYAVKKAAADSHNKTDRYQFSSFSAKTFTKGELHHPDVVGNLKLSSIEYDASNGTYSGLAWITFEPDVYLIEGRTGYGNTPEEHAKFLDLLRTKMNTFGSTHFKIISASATGFAIEFSEATLGERVYFDILTFCNENGAEAREALTIQIRNNANGVSGLWFNWDGTRDNHPFDQFLPATEKNPTYAVNIDKPDSSWSGTSSGRTYELDISKVIGEPSGDKTSVSPMPKPSIEPTVSTSPNLNSPSFTWVVRSGADVIEIIDSDNDSTIITNPKSIVPKKVGEAVIEVGGRGYQPDSVNPTEATPATITIKVTAMDGFEINMSGLPGPGSNDPNVKWTSTGKTGTARTYTLQLTKEGISPSNPNPPAPSTSFTFNREFGTGAKLVITDTIVPNTQKTGTFIVYPLPEDANTHTVTITGQADTKRGRVPVTITLTAYLEDDKGERLTNSVQIGVEVEWHDVNLNLSKMFSPRA